MDARFCFGYGSLVNRQTHSFSNLEPAELDGWQRTWTHHSHTGIQGVSSLSIRPATGVKIKGLISRVEPNQIAALDAREAGYDLHELPADGLKSIVKSQTVYTYISATDQPGDADYPILQSYLDTVISGFYNEFGERGIQHFLKTTQGWETPILSDRAAPIYPRTTPLSSEMAELVDCELKALGARWIT